MTEAAKKESNAIYNLYFNMGCGFDKSPRLAIIHIEGLIWENKSIAHVYKGNSINKRITHLEQVKAYLEEKR